MDKVDRHLIKRTSIHHEASFSGTVTISSLKYAFSEFGIADRISFYLSSHNELFDGLRGADCRLALFLNRECFLEVYCQGLLLFKVIRKAKGFFIYFLFIFY